MNKGIFTEFDLTSQEHHIGFKTLMRFYSKELDSHTGKTTTKDMVDKWVNSIVKMLNEKNRYLILCLVDDNLIGFAYGKIDKPFHKGYKKVGYGYIMEFFILPEFRRKGYGTKMFLQLQSLFFNDGAKQMYLTADGVTGKPFWESIGFKSTGELLPENNQAIFEKEITITSNIQIKILKYPNDKILSDITRRHGDNANEIMMCLSDAISSAHYKSDFFCVIAVDDLENVIGCANFFQSSMEFQKWFYTDLWVDACYRRRGVATRIVNVGMDYLSQLNFKILMCTVEPNNIASINLQKAIGFKEIPTEPFEDFDISSQIMFQISIEQNLSIIELTDRYDYLIFICDLLSKMKNVPKEQYQNLYKETRESLIINYDPKEYNYIIRKGIVPIGWAKINISHNDKALFITMHPKYENIDVEEYVSQYLKQYKFTK